MQFECFPLRYCFSLQSHGVHARQVYLNCMSMRTPQMLLKAVALSLTNSSDATRAHELKALLTSEKRESDGMMCVVAVTYC